MWQTSKVEVESTLRQVCEKVLNDPTVPKKLRYHRAEALRMMGIIYMVREISIVMYVCREF
ncbi:X-domain of DnaJ-containing-domain-containing protein [Jimgerdemannia flammicorona]|uniref:X-domain of DnaJ-containing-domain-containing protein n=1 Tax=Jimgerdemannia flammicorona TaxID=994334 RepID=A0A433DBX3_9FUNG|nr:X-domain of DnaJ-containing-domain-containing protein [Jimgerdemannia flammicorona]